jgi:hypothetical protein
MHQAGVDPVCIKLSEYGVANVIVADPGDEVSAAAQAGNRDGSGGGISTADGAEIAGAKLQGLMGDFGHAENVVHGAAAHAEDGGWSCPGLVEIGFHYYYFELKGGRA